MTIIGVDVLANTDPRLVCRSAGADVVFGEETLEGKVFVIHRRGEVAVGCQVESDARLRQLADGGRLGALAECEEQNGLIVATRMRLVANGGTGPAWVSGRHSDLLSGSARAWQPHALIASIGGRAASTLPRSERPRGSGDPVDIRIVGAIDERMVGLPERIAAAGDRSIRLLVDSGGGNIYVGRQIFDALAQHSHEVVARIIRAESMAAVVSLAADQRIIAPDGTMLLHQPNVSVESADANELRIHLRALDEASRELTALIAFRTGLDYDLVESWTSKETVFDAGTAVRCGLATGVDYDVVPAKPPKRRVRTQAIAAPFSSFRASPMRT